MARDRIISEDPTEVRLKLIGKRYDDARNYNIPMVSEVAALMVGDFDEAMGERDLLLESRDGDLQRISDLHPHIFLFSISYFILMARMDIRKRSLIHVQ